LFAFFLYKITRFFSIKQELEDVLPIVIADAPDTFGVKLNYLLNLFLGYAGLIYEREFLLFALYYAKLQSV
jgi:hypothetical protein